jgi:N-acetylmuramic acid 6-phosphate etherase
MRRPDYSRLPTERAHPLGPELDRMTALELVGVILDEEATAARAAQRCRREIARAVDAVAAALGRGGRLIYVGAGTSGRLAALDAAELPPTFGADPARVVAIVAGGARAMMRAVEGAEDRAETAVRRLRRLGVGPDDVVCAIAASGVTPFARAALVEARERAARTIFITCARDPEHARLADVVIAPQVGPELLAGSTRMKGGTVTKMILNALSTAVMVRLGKVYRGRMIDVQATNQKLRDRARRIVAELTGLSVERAQRLLAAAGGKPKVALAMHALAASADEARARLAEVDGDLRRLVELAAVSDRRRASPRATRVAAARSRRRR